jgi:hypothetical protein
VFINNDNALVGEVVILDVGYPDDPVCQGVIMYVYLKPSEFNFWGNVTEVTLTAVIVDSDGDVSEEPVEGLKLKKLVPPAMKKIVATRHQQPTSASSVEGDTSFDVL